MSRKTTQKGGLNTKNTGGAKPNNVLAHAGFNVVGNPYQLEDLIFEPTKEQLDRTVLEFIPFQTYDLWMLDRLQAIINNSTTTQAIIKQKSAYSIGDGFIVEPASENDILPIVRQSRRTEVDIQKAEEVNDFAKNVNSQGQNLEELTANIFTDLWSFGNAFIEVKKIKVGGTKKLSLTLLPVTYCRPKKAGKYEMYPTHIGVSSDFENPFYTTVVDPVLLPIYPVFDKIDGIERSIIHLRFYEPNMMYWGVPDWISAKIWGELEYRIPKFNQAKFENGFTPSAIISLFGSQDSEEARAVIDALKNCFTGTGNNSKMFVQALRDETYKADVQVLNSGYEGEFLELQRMAQDAIISAHRWTISLTGLRTAGSLGSNQQIRSEFDIVYNTVIRPTQRLVLNKFVNPILQTAADFLGYDWSNISLDISKPTPVSFAGDIDVQSVLSVDELRKVLGYEPLNNQNTVTNGDTN